MKKILLVDDEPDFLRFTAKRLRKNGFLVEQAEDGVSCLEKLAQFNPDLLLLDIRMPNKDGWEVCKILQDQKQTIPILLLTALADPGLQERAATAGAKGVLLKPIRWELLLEAIYRELGITP